jgi:hypothetical protein
MKKKKLTEAFPQIATADNFFQYGVPAPPSYYAFGGETELHKFTKKKGKSMPKAAAGMAMEDDPCPPDHFWDENQKKCIPFGEGVPSREQFFDQNGPYNEWQDELNYNRQIEDYKDWLNKKINEEWKNNYKGSDDYHSPEWKQFEEEVKKKYPRPKGKHNPNGTEPGYFHPEFELKQDYFPQDQEWDERSKYLYDNLFDIGTDDYRYDRIQKNMYRKQHPETPIPRQDDDPALYKKFIDENIKTIKPTPSELHQQHYDDWCPCMKKQEIFVEGKPVMKDVCVPCEEMNTAQLGGSLAGVPVYPQAQTEAQFFTPTYHNSNNAYKVGGSYTEEFPQAQRLNWGPTNHFMLQEGGDIPQQSQGMMPQGMLPKMQAGNGLNGIMAKTKQDMEHYYGGNYPMLQEGGAPPDQGSSNFYSDRVNTFLDKVRSRAYEALPQQVEESSLQEQGMAQYGYSGANMFNPNKVTPFKNAYESSMKNSQRANQEFMKGLNNHIDYNRYANAPQGQAAAKYGVALKKYVDEGEVNKEPMSEWTTVVINGDTYVRGKDGQLYSKAVLNSNSNTSYNDPYAVNRGGYNYNPNYFQSPYHRDYMVDWSNATMNQLTGDALKNAQISGAETLTRRALLPGNRNAGVRLYFNGYGQPVANPNGTNTGGGAGNTNPGGNTNPNGANTNPNGGNSTDPNDPGRPGFMGRLFPNRYNQHKFDVNQTDNDTNVDYTKLQSTITPEKYSEYQALLNPNKANRVTDRMQRIGDKADRMYQYQNMRNDIDEKYYEGRLDDTYGFSNRENRRVDRLTDRYNRVAGRNFREHYSRPEMPTKAYGGSLPRADYGIPPLYNPYNFNPELFNPNFNSGPLELPTMEQALERSRYPEGSRFSNTFLGKTTTYDKPIAEGMVAPMDFSKDPTAATGTDKGFFVDILQGRQKKDRDPDFPIALTKFAANKIENMRNPAKQEFARSTRADQVYSAVPTTSGSRGDYVMNTPAGQFFRPDDMNPWGKKNTGFNMPTAQYGGDQGDMVQNLKEGDEVYLTESQIQDIIKRGGKLSYL